MIRTTTLVNPFNRNPNQEGVIVYARIIERTAFDDRQVYEMYIEEYYLDVMGKKQIIRQPDGREVKKVIYSFEQADQLSQYLDAEFTINETYSARRSKYAELGHLVVNNQDQVYGSNWELVV